LIELENLNCLLEMKKYSPFLSPREDKPLFAEKRIFQDTLDGCLKL
jgi:hypothetical protein